MADCCMVPVTTVDKLLQANTDCTRRSGTMSKIQETGTSTRSLIRYSDTKNILYFGIRTNYRLFLITDLKIGLFRVWIVLKSFTTEINLYCLCTDKICTFTVLPILTRKCTNSTVGQTFLQLLIIKTHEWA